MKREGDKIYGTRAEINAFNSEQTVNSATNAVIGIGMAVTAATVILCYNLYSSGRQVSLLAGGRVRQFNQIFTILRGEEKASSINRRANIFSLIFCIIFSTISAFLGSGTSVGWLGFFAGAFILCLLLLFNIIKLNHIQIFGMKRTNKAYCEYCGCETQIVGYGQCRKCFNFFYHPTAEDTAFLEEYPFPNYPKFFRKTVDSDYFSTEVRATSDKKWLPKVGWLMIALGMVGGIVWAGANQPIDTFEKLGTIFVFMGAGLALYMILEFTFYCYVCSDITAFTNAVEVENERRKNL